MRRGSFFCIALWGNEGCVTGSVFFILSLLDSIMTQIPLKQSSRFYSIFELEDTFELLEHIFLYLTNQRQKPRGFSRVT